MQSRGAAQSPAIGFVQGASGTPDSPSVTVSVNYPKVETAGDMNIVVVGWNDTSSTVQSVTDSAGNVYKLAVGPTYGSVLWQSIYYAPNIVGGGNTVTVTFNQSAVYPDIRILEYSGVSTLDAAAAATGSGTTASTGPALTSSANELIFGADMIQTTTVGSGSGFTARVVSGDSNLAEDRTVSASGSYNATATVNSGAWVIQMATFTSALPPSVGTLSGLSCTTNSFSGAGSDTCMVSLSAAAGTGGLAVGLSSNNSAVTVPSSVTVPAGSSSVSFTAAVSAASSTQTATLTASAGTISKTFAISLTYNAPVGIAFVQAASGTPDTPSSTVSVSYPKAETAGDMNIVVVGWNDTTSTVQSVTDSAGNAYKLAVGPTYGSVLWQSIYYAPKIAGGSDTVKVTFSQAATYPDIRVLEYQGVSTLDATAAATGSGNSASTGTAATTSANELIFGADMIQTTTVSPGGGFAARVVSGDSNLAEDETVTSSGSYSAAATVNSGAWVIQMATFSNAVSSPVAGPTAPGLTLGSASVAFGNVNLNSPATQPVALTSSGTAALTINGGSVTGAGFSLSGLTFPVTLNPGQTATLYIGFDPTVAGAATGAVTLASNASPGTATISLSGTGQTQSYQVALTWAAPANSSDPVAGYHIYRATSGGTSYQLLNSSADVNTAYTDTTVQNGASYTYYVKSVDASGNESVPSNTYTATIP